MSDGRSLIDRAPAARALLDAARSSGLALDGVWLVGGVVRDAAMGRASGRDIDLAVEGAGVAFAHLLAGATGGELVAEHAFGTATVLVDLGAEHGLVHVDVATTRTETYAEPGALPTVAFDATIEQDLARRDITINAIAVAAAASPDGSHRIADPLGGLQHLVERRIAVLHQGSFADDPTRIIRVARYSGRLGLPVDPDTRELAVAAVAAGALQTISADRMRAELELVLREPAWDALTLLAAWGVLDQLDPRLEESFRLPFLIMRIDGVCGDDAQLNDRVWRMRLAALVRPLAGDRQGWLRWLGFPGDVVERVEGHAVLLDIMLGGKAQRLVGLANSDLYLELGEVDDDSFAVAALATDDAALLERLDAYRTAIRETRLTVRGDDVMAAGVPAGPRVGRILGTLFLRSLDGELPDEAAERAALAELAAAATEHGADA
ncbi:MAG: putative poly polymerase [Thermoleophilia bacterium]|nr:putative poly polymerase [Thermoleophilia bacterium]